MSTASFGRLVRFEDSNGEIQYGEVPEQLSSSDDLTNVDVRVYNGGLPWGSSSKLGTSTAKIARVLSPISTAPIVYGIDLNYRKHAEEAKIELPPFPLIFLKGAGLEALAGLYEDIPIHKEADFMDHEREFTIVFSKRAINLTESDNVFDYLLIRSGGQHGYAKAFDKFAPIGPILASTSQIPHLSRLTLNTTVNGEQRQLTQTDDFIFDIPSIVRHLTRGRTINPGTLVITGTPSGVAAFHKPPAWLKDGDVVEVEITEVGKIRNKMVFVKNP
ncbi:uncharacterized protein A1O5_08108 [Cladophialophora psammophila CBS 110553]|uniref:Fumarylacetoacetase-like C-terminal domain-containing protein n=1 Tax=Cladophialophora psammophila CBS 110553 TaxID=1182543 RepID=W9WMQ3_9EURO|nr:uncharacterized protein A1O5_08108 [Cladophialophora psammophila CBS 110553]EXJ69173.1 hypothetical protein A1O5_08108 [Cladophialophora psammophila CBS 110553]